MTIPFERKRIVTTICNNVKELYKGGDPQVVDAWMEHVEKYIHEMLDDPLVGMMRMEECPEDLKQLGIEIGETYEFADYTHQQMAEILTNVYILTIYAKAVAPDKDDIPEYELILTETAFGIKDNTNA